LRVFLTALFVILLGYAVSFVLFVGNLPVASSAMPRADGIVVLTGGDDRLDTAVALLEKGAGRRLLVSGAGMATTKRAVGHIAGGGARFQCCADIGYAAEDTHGNADEARDWAHAHHFGSLIIVTARYHMPRAMVEFSAAMPDITLIPWPVDQDGIDLGGWWRRPRTVQLLHREYVKYLASLAMTRLAQMRA
jgi:uncharacterized SAM-binding protein YcdF (DUF218 family)